MKSVLGSTLLEHERINGNRRALCRPRAIVEVVEGATEASIEDVGSTKRKRTIVANREACGDDSSGLRRSIKLKLIIGSDVADAALLIFENTVLERNGKRIWLFAVQDGVTIITVAGWRYDST